MSLTFKKLPALNPDRDRVQGLLSMDNKQTLAIPRDAAAVAYGNMPGARGQDLPTLTGPAPNSAQALEFGLQAKPGVNPAAVRQVQHMANNRYQVDPRGGQIPAAGGPELEYLKGAMVRGINNMGMGPVAKELDMKGDISGATHRLSKLC